MTLTAGTRLGPYEIERPLGEGGMGTVYAARDTRLERPVAVKVIRGGTAASTDRRRFLNEAKAASSLNHPHIVTVHDVGSERGVDYLTMELVDGAPLDRIIDGRPLPVARVLRTAIQIADAMAAAHRAGLAHRDLKPANIMIGKDDRVKVLDFGLARLLDVERSASLATRETTGAGMLVGTLSYMAPEQAEGRSDVDHRVDVFAFGAVLYEMLTGHAAFARESGLASVAAVLHEEPRAIGEIRVDVPADLQRLVERCLRKDPSRRLQSMADLHVALQDIADDLASGQNAAAPVARATSPQTRWAIVAAIAVVAIVIAAVVVWRAGPTPQPASTPILTRMTFDNGFTVDPAVSPDGSLLAYASDRAGNLDIWIQQIAGGTPIRLTSGSEDERQPSFSPDGSRIVFRSERDGGGLYVIPTLGGQPPRFLTARGRAPRYSPDGTTIAFWTGSEIGFARLPGAYRTFVIPAAGGSPTEIGGFTNARFPIWSPDGKHLIVSATRAEPPTGDSYDWWRVSLDGSMAHSLGAADRFRAEGLQENLSGQSGVQFGAFGPSAWTDRRVLFSDNRTLWSFGISDDGTLEAAPQRLTLGTSLDSDPSAGPGGLVAFMSAVSEGVVWALPLDPESGIAAGPPERLTEGAGPFSRPSASLTGEIVAYRHDLGSLLIKDLRSGIVADAGVTRDAFGPALSPDGAVVSYREGNGVRVVPVKGGTPRSICENCSLGEWFAHQKSLVVVAGDDSGAQRFLQVDVETGASRAIVEAPGAILNRPHLRPDDRAIAFRQTREAAGSLLVVTHIAADKVAGRPQWVQVAGPENDLRPCAWSADGRILYFLSGRDGNRCLYAQRIDPTTLRPDGSPVAVRHEHSARNFRAGQAGVLSTGPSNAVRGRKFFYDLRTIAADIWTLRPRASR